MRQVIELLRQTKALSRYLCYDLIPVQPNVRLEILSRGARVFAAPIILDDDELPANFERPPDVPQGFGGVVQMVVGVQQQRHVELGGRQLRVTILPSGRRA